MDWDKTAEIVEKFLLAFTLKRLKCPIIEKRVNGQETLSDVANAVTRRGGEISSGDYRWINAKTFYECLEQNEILELLFGDKWKKNFHKDFTETHEE